MFNDYARFMRMVGANMNNLSHIEAGVSACVDCFRVILLDTTKDYDVGWTSCCKKCLDKKALENN